MSEADTGAPISESPYDPELPFLEELEHEIHRRALRAARAARRPPAPIGAFAAGTSSGMQSLSAERAHTDHGPRQRMPPRGHGERRRRRGSTAARIARRSVTLVALLCLLAATAFATRAVLAGGDAHDPTAVQQGSFVPVAAGGSGAERWTLRLYRRGGQICRALAVAESEASRCSSSPAPDALGVTSVVGPRRRYLFGVTGHAVARIAIRAGGIAQTVATREPSTAQVDHGGLAAGTRYFVSIVSRPSVGADPPALVRPLNAAGGPLGPVRVDCVEMAQPEPCRR